MSDYEVIMLLLQVLAIVIAFGALVALICLTKSKQPSVTAWQLSKQKGHFLSILIFEMRPDVSTRLTIFLYYRDKVVYRQIVINEYHCIRFMQIIDLTYDV